MSEIAHEKKSLGSVAMSVIRYSVLALGITGCLVFTSAFLASVIKPEFVEQAVKDVIRYQVEKKAREKVEAIDDSFLVKKAKLLAEAYSDEIALTKKKLSEKLPALIAKVIAEMQDLDCECRKKIETMLVDGLKWKMESALQAQEQLTSFIRAKYMDTATQLTREFRIFTGTNAVVFALLIVAVLIKRKAGAHLLPAALVLFVAAAVTAYLYLFKQDWLHTIIFSDYIGFAYICYLGVAFAFLCDLIINRARVTAKLLNVFLNAIGNVSLVAPC